MRDVMTVPYGVTVTLNVDKYVNYDAVFRGVHDGRMILETGNGTFKVRPSDRTIVLFGGRELGFVEPDPPLPTVTPDLE